MTRTLCMKPVSPVGLGCMGMSEFYGETDDSVSLKTLTKAYELGYRHFDTADMYGVGHNEKLLGTFIKSLGCDRENIVLSSKVGIVRDMNNKYKLSVDGSKEYIKSACEKSLKRLGTEYIDLYYLHRRDPNIPLEETVTALADLIKEGKIRAIGLCEVSLDTLKSVQKLHPVAAVQSEYSLWSRDVEDAILPICLQMGVAFVAFSPMGRGFLTGSITKDRMKKANPEIDFRTKLPRFNSENIDANLELVSKMKNIADAVGATPAQIALSWILSKGDNIFVIPGTKTPSFLSENLASQDVVLNASVMRELNQLFTPESVHGGRYPQEILARSNG